MDKSELERSLPARFRELAVVALLLFALSSTGQVDISDEVTMARGGYVFNRATNTFDSIVTLKNTGNLARQTPVYLVIVGIAPKSVSLANSSGTTPDGNPYLLLPISAPRFEPGSAISVVLKFNNPTKTSFSYGGRILTQVLMDIGKDVVFEPPALPVDALQGLPRNPHTGNPIVLPLPMGALEYDSSLKDPITAVGKCTGWISACYRPGLREMDDCARSAPKCTTGTPWLESMVCCPASCFVQYRQARLAGVSVNAAFLRTYFVDGSCFPGYRGLQR